MVFSRFFKKLLSSQDEAEIPTTTGDQGAKSDEAAPLTSTGESGGIDRFVDYVVRSLVDEPDQVSLETVEKDRQTVVQITCSKSDIGKIIGKSGKTIAAIRTLVSGAGGRVGKRITVEVMD